MAIHVIKISKIIIHGVLLDSPTFIIKYYNVMITNHSLGSNKFLTIKRYFRYKYIKMKT